jgi:hypothetical protein
LAAIASTKSNGKEKFLFPALLTLWGNDVRVRMKDNPLFSLGRDIHILHSL